MPRLRVCLRYFHIGGTPILEQINSEAETPSIDQDERAGTDGAKQKKADTRKNT
jgi:hypothetical protein